MLSQGRNLKPGNRAICVSSVDGIITNSPEFLVLNQKDKKGNLQLVNVTDGEVCTASPLSVWDTWDNPTANAKITAPRV